VIVVQGNRASTRKLTIVRQKYFKGGALRDKNMLRLGGKNMLNNMINNINIQNINNNLEKFRGQDCYWWGGGRRN